MDALVDGKLAIWHENRPEFEWLGRRPGRTLSAAAARLATETRGERAGGGNGEHAVAQGTIRQPLENAMAVLFDDFTTGPDTVVSPACAITSQHQNGAVPGCIRRTTVNNASSPHGTVSELHVGDPDRLALSLGPSTHALTSATASGPTALSTTSASICTTAGPTGSPP